MSSIICEGWSLADDADVVKQEQRGVFSERSRSTEPVYFLYLKDVESVPRYWCSFGVSIILQRKLLRKHRARKPVC